jgi:hypothetical protein
MASDLFARGKLASFWLSLPFDKELLFATVPLFIAGMFKIGGKPVVGYEDTSKPYCRDADTKAWGSRTLLKHIVMN